MTNEQLKSVVTKTHILTSVFLKRDVTINCYLPTKVNNRANLSLLLINDGQDLLTMNFEDILDNLYEKDQVEPMFCVGIHCSTDRKNEYGTAKYLDYKGRGAKAALFNQFVFEELLPFIRVTYSITSFKEKCYAGFSLGGLCALDIVWNHANEFTKVGVFSGSLWWRDKDQEAVDFDENENRIMHKQIRDGKYAPWLRFFFEVGTQDETADRNNNGVIDSIDDTLSLIDELEKKGYNKKRDTYFLELLDGKHDVTSWGKAFPEFLKWGWGVNDEVMD
jgi:enterochelin esterase-like enzyme